MRFGFVPAWVQGSSVRITSPRPIISQLDPLQFSRLSRIPPTLTTILATKNTSPVSPMRKPHGKRAFVTAGAQGIGLAISRQLLAAGCDLFVHYHRSADAARGLEVEARELGRRYAHAAADLTQSSECQRLIDDAVRFLGGQ